MTDFEVTDRGFKHYESVTTLHGHRVKVYESSAASEPCLWLSVKLTAEDAQAAHSNIEPEDATAHMTLAQATEVRDAIDACIANHYQRET